MRATPYPSQQSYYSQPYQFYYTPTGRYCAYDAKSGTHLIHSLTDNRWYSYIPGIIAPSQQYSQQHPHLYNQANRVPHQHYQHQSHGVPRTFGVRDANPNGDQCKSRERYREPVSRNQREELLYSAADVEAAERSLIEDNNIDNDVYFEDEGVDVRMGERIGRPRRTSNERQRQRSRSGLERRNNDETHRSSPYSQEASRARTTPGPQIYHTVNHTCQQQQTRTHTKHTHNQHFGSNQAGVGYEGSEHDSGYMDDCDPIPVPPRKSMPGVARWLDNTPSEFSMDDGQHPFDVETNGMRYTQESHSRSPHSYKPEWGTNSDPLLDKSHHCNYRTTAPTYHTEARATQKTQSRMNSRRDDRYSSSAAKTLHRQDSGIDMSDAMIDEVDIEIDIHMGGTSEAQGGDIHLGPGFFPRGSPHPAYASLRRSRHPSNSRKTEEEFECYYTIPPCPNLPPLEEPATGAAEMVYLGRQELTAPHYLRNLPVSPSFRQADSVYTASIAATPRSRYHHTSPAMLPRAPSPPLSPSPDHTQRTRRSGLGVPVVDYERGYPGARW